MMKTSEQRKENKLGRARPGALCRQRTEQDGGPLQTNFHAEMAAQHDDGQ